MIREQSSTPLALEHPGISPAPVLGSRKPLRRADVDWKKLEREVTKTFGETLVRVVNP